MDRRVPRDNFGNTILSNNPFPRHPEALQQSGLRKILDVLIHSIEMPGRLW
jgi:hypothetical protein